MVDSATARFGARKQSLGSNVNTWGDTKLNDVLDLLDRGTKGFQSIAVTGDTTLAWTSYATANQGQVQTVKLTGALAAAASLIVPSREWAFTVINAAGHTVTVRTSGGVGVTIPTGYQAQLYCDGTDVANAAPTVVTGAAQISGGLQVGGRISNMTAAVADTDAVNKSQMDGAIAAATTSTTPGTLRVTSTDTTAKFLNSALSVTGALTKTVNSPGANETLDISYMPRATQPVPVVANTTLSVGTRTVISTSGGAISAMLLPSTGYGGGALVDGDYVDIVDIGGALETNTFTLGGNGKNIKFQDQAAAATLTWLGPNWGRLECYWDASADLWLVTGV